MNHINGIIIFFFGVMFLCACSAAEERADTPFKAQVLHFATSGDAKAGEWNISEQTLPTLEDPDSLKGSDFEILTGQRLIVDFTVGSLIQGTITGGANKKTVRYSVKNGVIVPRDTTTLLLFSAFHSIEQVLAQVEPATGLKMSELKSAVGNRYQVLFEPTIEPESNTRVSIKMNAAFNSQSDNLILFRRSGLQGIPLAANIKVLSHEFGHALFKNSFFSQRDESCPSNDPAGARQRATDKFFKGRLNTEYTISGINEGFADFNSYVMTGEINALEGSFTDTDISSRSLMGPKFTFSQLSQEGICKGRFYCIGTLFARALYNASSKYGKNSEELRKFSRKIFAALGSTVRYMNETPSTNLLPLPSFETASCTRRDVIDIQYDGAVAAAFLSAFLRGMSADGDKDSLCEQFATLFGQIGFPEEARIVCKS